MVNILTKNPYFFPHPTKFMILFLPYFYGKFSEKSAREFLHMLKLIENFAYFVPKIAENA